MQALELNLSTRPFRNNTLPWIGLVLGTLGLVALTTWNVRSYRRHAMLYTDLVSQTGTIEEQLGDLDRRDEKAQREVKKRDLEFLAVQAEKANEVIRWKAFSWTRLFNRLQEVQPNNVQMTAVHPVFRPESQGGARHGLEDPDQVPVSVEGVARSLADFSALQRSLIDDPYFDRVEPERIQRESEGNGETVFRIRFLYDPRVGQEPPQAAEALAAAEAEAEGAAPGEDAPGVSSPAQAKAQSPPPVPPAAGSEISAEGWDRPGLEGEN